MVLRERKQAPRDTAACPEISRFLGIVIAMYYRDHAPPHFHALYGEYGVTVGIAAGEVNGDIPKRAWTRLSLAILRGA